MATKIQLFVDTPDDIYSGKTQKLNTRKQCMAEKSNI